MLVIFALTIGALFACGVYLLLRRDLIAVAFGFGAVGTAVNALILVAARARPMQPTLIDDARAGAELGNPLPQAFVLTAIVIGVAVVTLLLSLSRQPDRNHARTGGTP